MAPLKMLLPLSVRAPEPILLRPNAPLMARLMAICALLATLTVVALAIAIAELIAWAVPEFTWIKAAALPSCIVSVPVPLLATVPPKLPAPLKLSRERARELPSKLSVPLPPELPIDTGVVEAMALLNPGRSVP